MNSLAENKTRDLVRYDHAYISMKAQYNEDWHWVKALHWNDRGFNFFCPEVLSIGTQLSFKKGLSHFEGSVVWQRQEVSGADLIEMAVNVILLERITKDEMQKDIVQVNDVIAMIRNHTKAQVKLQYAEENLSLVISEEDIREKIAHNQWAELGQVGVEVHHPGWLEVVKEALIHSQGILALDQSRMNSIGKVFENLNGNDGSK